MSSLPLRRKALLVASAILLPAPAYAQTPHELPPITAEAPETPPLSPAAVTLSGAALASRQASSADAIALLSDQPGVAASSNGGISSLPVLRGLNDDRVLVTVDGQAITSFCPNHMNPPGSYVLANRVRSITVSPTLAPVSVGGDNIAGVIAIASAPIVFSRTGVIFSGEAGMSYRSVANAPGATLSASLANERLSVAYAAAWSRADNYAAGGGDQVRSTTYEAFDHAVTLGFRPSSGHQLSLRVGEARVPYEGFPNQRMDMVDNYSAFANFDYEGALGWGTLNTSVSWRHVGHEMNFLADKQPANMPMLSDGYDTSERVALQIPLSNQGALRFGVEGFQTHLKDWWPPVTGSMMMSPNAYININDGTRSRLGGFAEWETRPSAHWTTLAGVRFERVETNAGDVQPYSWMMSMMTAPDINAANAFNARDHKKSDDIFDATLSATWRPGDALALELGAARRTRVPNLYERYAWGEGSMSSAMTSFAGDANSYVGATDLAPEVAHSVAATLRLGADDSDRSLTLSAYHSWVSDYIDADLMANLSGGFVRLRFANHDARVYGLELSGHLNLWDSDALGRGRVRGSAAWTRGENADTGDNLYHVAPLTAHLAIEQRIGRWTNSAEVDLVDEKDAVNRLRHEPLTDAYALLHLRTSADFGRVRLNLAAENILDASYDLPLGGVSYGDYRYGGSIGPIQPLPGPGRSINVGLTYAF